MARKRPFVRWVRVAHRWVSMAFVIVATVLIVQVVPAGPATDAVSVVAIVGLVFMIITGTWMAVHHYVLKLRRPAARRSDVTAGV